MQIPVFYPLLSQPDLHIIRSPGPGLGNLLFPWARATLLAEGSGGRVIAPTWRNLKIGPFLRRERDKRTYGDLFSHRTIEQFTSDLYLKIFSKDWISEEDYRIRPRPSLVIVKGEGNHFAELKGASYLLRQRLSSMCRLPVGQPISGIGIHIRLGDFSDTEKDTYRRNSRIPVEWFCNEAEKLQKLFLSPSITIFTDDIEGVVAKAFKNFKGVCIAKNGNAIQDILRLASAEHIVCSNSTFSLWSAFISGSSFSTKFPDLLDDYSLSVSSCEQGFRVMGSSP